LQPDILYPGPFVAAPFVAGFVRKMYNSPPSYLSFFAADNFTPPPAPVLSLSFSFFCVPGRQRLCLLIGRRGGGGEGNFNDRKKAWQSFLILVPYPKNCEREPEKIKRVEISSVFAD
jgi:hypothetical protein